MHLRYSAIILVVLFSSASSIFDWRELGSAAAGLRCGAVGPGGLTLRADSVLDRAGPSRQGGWCDETRISDCA